jgi:hypothetical protein
VTCSEHAQNSCVEFLCNNPLPNHPWIAENNHEFITLYLHLVPQASMGGCGSLHSKNTSVTCTPNLLHTHTFSPFGVCMEQIWCVGYTCVSTVYLRHGKLILTQRGEGTANREYHCSIGGCVNPIYFHFPFNAHDLPPLDG